MTAPLFHLRGIHFAYDAHRPVLCNADFLLARGDRLALVGPNGAGKTTLFHLMIGLLRPHAGQIEVFGRPRTCEADFYDVRARVGLLFQDPDDQLFCPTVEEDVAFGPLNLGATKAEARAIVTETLAMLGLRGFERRITYKLSGGQRRLVSLAAVLAMRPEVLLLDEPTNALDEATRQRLIEILAGLPQTMMVITHDAPFIDRLGMHRVQMDRGRIAA